MSVFLVASKKKVDVYPALSTQASISLFSI